MKRLLDLAVAIVLTIALVFILKIARQACWDHKKLLLPPSLTSLDPTERVEAAKQLGKKFGGVH